MILTKIGQTAKLRWDVSLDFSGYHAECGCEVEIGLEG